MKTTLELVAAPTITQPGGYVPRVFATRTQPMTPSVEMEAVKGMRGWRVRLVWPCPEPVQKLTGETDRFPDAAALLVPAVDDAPWITMGATGKAVEGVLWRADKDGLLKVEAEGMGTMKREASPEGWRADAKWDQGQWVVSLELPGWKTLQEQKRLAVAVWRGSAADRGGLKSISPGWVEVES